MKKNPFTRKQDVTINATENCYDGHFKLKKYYLEHRLFAGGWSPTLERELLLRSRVAAAIPYDPYRNELLLIEQFRIGAIEQALPWLLEFVAGVADQDETPEDVIIREIQEEAGVKALALKKIHEYWVSPGSTNEHLTLYCAKIDATLAGGLHGLKDENEDILVHVVNTEIAFQLLANGKINNSLTIIGLQWLQLNKVQLDNEWKK